MQYLSIEAVNNLDKNAFVDAFGDVAEHSPWVAAKAFGFAPFKNVSGLVDAFAVVLRGADVDRQLQLICEHPDLAGKAAVAGELGPDSKAEQAQAGINELSEAEFERFTSFNTRYRERFGFPFILAVKGATKEQILASFAERIDNDPPVEFRRALDEICRIMMFRLEGRVNAS